MAEIGEVSVKFSADTAEFAQATARITKQIRDLGNRFREFGRSLSFTVSGPLGLLAGAAIKSAIAAGHSAGAWDRFRATIQRFQLALGDLLLPTFEAFLDSARSVIETIRGFISSLNESAPAISALIAKIVGIGVVLGPILVMLGMLIRVGANLIAMIAKIGAALAWLAAHPIAILAVALGGAVVGITALIAKFASASAAATNAAEGIANVGSAARRTSRDMEAGKAAVEEWLKEVSRFREAESILTETNKAVFTLERLFSATGNKAEYLAGKVRLAEEELRKLAALQTEMREASEDIGIINEQWEYAIKRYRDATAEQNAYKRSLDAAAQAEAMAKTEAENRARAMEAAQAPLQQFKAWVASLTPSLATVYEGVHGLTDAISYGLGNALAQAIVYGENWAEAFKRFGQEILATVIQMFVKIGIEAAVGFLLQQVLGLTNAISQIANYAAITYAGVFATTAAALGPFWPAAIGVAAAAASAMEAGAMAFLAAGRVPAAAEGGLVRAPTLALIGEAGPELVIPLDRVGGFAAHGAESHVVIEMDGYQVAKAIIPHIPRAIYHRVGGF